MAVCLLNGLALLLLLLLPRQVAAPKQVAESPSITKETVKLGNPTYEDAEFLRRRNMLVGCPEDYFTSKRPLLRYEFAVTVERVFRVLKESTHALPAAFSKPLPGLVEPGFVTPMEFEAMKRLYKEFRTEVRQLGNDPELIDQWLADIDKLLKSVLRKHRGE